MSRLTTSQENYLRTVLVLSHENGGVRQIDIVNHLGISRPSACIAIAKLEQNGFVTRDAHRLISLTQNGEREAKRIIDNFTVINLFLTSKLNVDSHTAFMDAGKLEHVVSDETVNALRLLLDRQSRRDDDSLHSTKKENH
jgi:Mn-dependent DtxR family transcriptional regulator